MRRSASQVTRSTRGQRGEGFRAVVAHDGFGDVVAGRVGPTEFARRVGVSHSTVVKALQAHHEDEARGVAADGWVMDGSVRRMLMLDEPAPDQLDDQLEDWLGRMVDAFVAFRDEFFELRPGVRWLTGGFHRRWIRETLRAIVYGQRLMILSPPRHGKSELLVHFCVWMICRDPNIRIMWISGNADIGKLMLSAVKTHLESNQLLLRAVLPPDESFYPTQRMGANWKAEEFTVANRTMVSPSPTMVALGRGGKILSRTVDLIVCDDIEDHDSTLQPARREDTRKWAFTQVESRKEGHTGWVIIGSRQHPDDLYGYMLDDPSWTTIVDSAHDPACLIDPDDSHYDCMLFPELRSWVWLNEKRTSAAARGLEGHWEMVYLNAPRPEGLAIFVKEHMDACLNPNRGVGTEGLPSDLQIVAGLDPAATGYQAGVCWAWANSTQKLYLIDLNNRAGGGIEAFLELADNWTQRHHVAHWVVEDMGFQKGYRTDPRVREWANDHGVYIEGHTTGVNKADPLYGVGSMSRLYDDRVVDLPYGTSEAREKTNLLIRQAVRFTEDHSRGTRNRAKTDVLMASWFPMKVIRRWRKEFTATMNVTYDPSFTTIGMTDWGEKPW